MFRAPTCRILVTDCRTQPQSGQGFVKDCDRTDADAEATRGRIVPIGALFRRSRCAARAQPLNGRHSQNQGSSDMKTAAMRTAGVVLAATALLAPALLATAVDAQPKPETRSAMLQKLVDCRKLTDESARLACY